MDEQLSEIIGFSIGIVYMIIFGAILISQSREKRKLARQKNLNFRLEYLPEILKQEFFLSGNGKVSLKKIARKLGFKTSYIKYVLENNESILESFKIKGNYLLVEDFKEIMEVIEMVDNLFKSWEYGNKKE